MDASTPRPNVVAAFSKKVRRGIFAPVARYLPEHVAEDRLQEAVCMTYEMFARYADRGVELPDAILVHSCRQRATDAGRRFVPADGQPKRDVLDPRHQLERRFEVLCLDGLPSDDGDLPSSDGDRDVALQAAFRLDPTRDIVSAISLDEWLEGLSARDQRLLVMRAEGFTLGEIGDELRLSVSVVFQRLQFLGKALAEHAGIRLSQRKRGSTRRASLDV